MLATEANESGTSGVFPSKIPVVANQRTDEGTSVLSEIARAVPIEMEQLWLRVKKQLHGLLCCSSETQFDGRRPRYGWPRRALFVNVRAMHQQMSASTCLLPTTHRRCVSGD